MKKLLLSGIVGLMALNVSGQRVENPLVLEIGSENTYEFSGSYSTPVYIYTAPEDQMVTLEPTPANATVTVTEDGNAWSSKKLPSLKYGGNYMFIVKKDATVYLNVTAYSSPIKLLASAEAYEYNLGVTPEEAIALKDDGKLTFIPFREENYKEVPVYMSYTAQEDGALELTFSGYVHNAYFSVDGGEFSGITCKSLGGDYRTFVPVEAGKSYIIKMESTKAAMVSAELTHPVYGESPDYPVVITDGTAEVPAKAGKYYYEVTGTESGYGVVSSEVTDFDGIVSWGRTVESTLATVADGSFDLRQVSTLGGHYYIIVDKKSDTAETQKFNVRFETAQPYDSFYNGEELTFGVATALPPYAGTYYYKVTLPETGAYMLNVAPVVPFTESTSTLKLYRTSDSSTALWIGEPDIDCEVQAATSYIVKVEVKEADKRSEITATIRELQQGDGASNPFEMVIGKNELTAGNAKYYLYKAEKSSWAIVKPADMSINQPVVTCLKNANQSYETNITILKYGDDAYRFEAVEGRDYLLKFTKVKEDTSFEFEVPDYAQGESRDNPFVSDGRSITIPTAPGTYWWSYSPERTGKLQLSTDFKYDVVSSPTRQNEVSLISAETGYTLMSLPIDYTNEVFNAAKYNVEEGKGYFVRVTSVSEQTDKTVDFELADLDPGETASNAIIMDYTTNPFEYYFPKLGSRSEGKWYAIDLREGELTISTTKSLSFYFYKADNTDKYLYYASTIGSGYEDVTNPDTGVTSQQWVTRYGMKDKAITEAGRYVMIAYYWYTPDLPVTFSGTALKENVGVEGVGVDNGAEQSFAVFGNEIAAFEQSVVYDVAGRQIMTIPAGESRTLSNGIYIVRSGEKAAKIAVK